jgi:hypothetical protein
MSRGQHSGTPTAVNLSFLDRSRYSLDAKLTTWFVNKLVYLNRRRIMVEREYILSMMMTN